MENELPHYLLGQPFKFMVKQQDPSEEASVAPPALSLFSACRQVLKGVNIVALHPQIFRRKETVRAQIVIYQNATIKGFNE